MRGPSRKRSMSRELTLGADKSRLCYRKHFVIPAKPSSEGLQKTEYYGILLTGNEC